jgi:hypothetical protein
MMVGALVTPTHIPMEQLRRPLPILWLKLKRLASLQPEPLSLADALAMITFIQFAQQEALPTVTSAEPNVSVSKPYRLVRVTASTTFPRRTKSASAAPFHRLFVQTKTSPLRTIAFLSALATNLNPLKFASLLATVHSFTNQYAAVMDAPT